MDQSLSLIVENVKNVGKEEYLMFSETNRIKSFQNWPFNDRTACNPKTLVLFVNYTQSVKSYQFLL